MTYHRINELVYLLERKFIFFTSIIEITYVKAHSQLSVLFRDNHHIGQPSGVLDWTDETFLQETVHFFGDNFFSFCTA